MTKLTDTQATILYFAINHNHDIVPTLASTKLECDARAYGSALAGMVKKGLLEIAGAATANDHNKDGWRFRVTPAGIEAFDEDEYAEFIEALEADTDEADDEEAHSGSRIKEEYKRVYAERKALGGSGQGCADALDRWMSDTFMIPAEKGKRMVLDLTAFGDFAAQNNINIAKYAGLNTGMIRMNVTNTLRARLRKGQDVHYDGRVVVKGVADAITEVKKAKRASKADAQSIAA
jgi:hypothetical protein